MSVFKMTAFIKTKPGLASQMSRTAVILTKRYYCAAPQTTLEERLDRIEAEIAPRPFQPPPRPIEYYERSRDKFTLHQKLDILHADNKTVNQKLDILHADNKTVNQKLDALRADNNTTHQKLDALNKDNKTINQQLGVLCEGQEVLNHNVKQILDALKAMRVGQFTQ